MPVDLMAPKGPLYILPTALPASGKSTFAKLYTAYLGAKDYEVIVIERDAVIKEVMEEVNAANKEKDGYPLTYKGMHAENWLNDDGTINSETDPDGEETNAERSEAAYYAAKAAMREVLDRLATMEKNARERSSKEGVANLVVIHDDLNLTPEKRGELRDGGVIGQVVQGPKWEARKEQSPTEAEEENDVLINETFSEGTKNVSMLFELMPHIREAMRNGREGAGGHGIPEEVMKGLCNLYERGDWGTDGELQNGEEAHGRPSLNEGFESVVGANDSIPNGREFTDGLAEELGFSATESQSATVTMLEAFKAAGYPFDSVNERTLQNFVESRIDEPAFTAEGNYSAFDCAVYAVIDACGSNPASKLASKATYEMSKATNYVKDTVTDAANTVKEAVLALGNTTPDQEPQL